MAGSVRSGSGRIRLNVSALLADQVTSKFLVVVDEDCGMDQLVAKVQKTLRNSGVSSTVEQVLNSCRASLPADEVVGDMLRDGEEVFVILRGTNGTLLHNQKASSLDAPTQKVNVAEPLMVAGDETLPVRATVTLPAGFHDSSDEEEMSPTRRDARRKEMQLDFPLNGPMEDFQDERMPYEFMQVDHPCEPVQLTSYDNDWLVENMTPRLREFVMSNFQGDLITEPKYVASIGKYVGARFLQASGSFISVFVRPQTVLGSDLNATMPVNYYIAKADIQSFMRQAEGHMSRLKEHQDLFNRTLNALRSLMSKGMSENEHVAMMLPHSYNAFEEVEGMMLEADRPLFPVASSGAFLVVIVDTSGPVGLHLPYIKGALKRALHAKFAAKAGFQMIRFALASGEPRLWAQQMMQASEPVLQSAEDWIDALTPVNKSNLVKAVNLALAHEMCDEIYILSSSDIDRSHHEALLMGIRSLNTREVPIYTVGIEPQPHSELLLRNIAESNHGDFSVKHFNEGARRCNVFGAHDAKFASWRTNLVNGKSKQLSETFKKQKMSIGSQMRIIEVMLREESAKESSWMDEWRCAQRLLLVQKNHVPDRDEVKELERRSARSLSARVGGGYVYQTGEMQIGFEQLFEHKSAVPWTDHSDTVAVGPKVPGSETLQRTAKFPPSRDMLPLAPPRPPSPARPSGGNPWSGSDRAKRPPSAKKRGNSSARGSRGNSSVRASSADRAAGVRAPSPAAKKKVKPQVAPERPKPEPEPVQPTLERRWSF